MVSRVAAAVLAVAALAVLAASCGRATPQLTLDPIESTTTTALDPVAPPATDAVTSETLPPTTATWTPAAGNLAGLPSTCGTVSLVSSYDAGSQMIASVANHGLWTSADGAMWNQLGGVPNRGSQIVYDPENTGTYWESGLYGDSAVYRTDDAGASFQRLGNLTSSDSVSVDLTDPLRSTLLATQHERSTIYRSVDGGKTWQDISGALPPAIGFTEQPYVVDATTYVLGTRSNDSADTPGVFRTADGGMTWTQVFDLGVAGPPLVASDGSLYFVTSPNGGIVRSVDDGQTWELVADEGTVLPSTGRIVELPDGELAAMGDHRVIISAAGGESWQSYGPQLPIDNPTGFGYFAAGELFFVWQLECDEGVSNLPIKPDSIMTLALGEASG